MSNIKTISDFRLCIFCTILKSIINIAISMRWRLYSGFTPTTYPRCLRKEPVNHLNNFCSSSELVRQLCFCPTLLSPFQRFRRKLVIQASLFHGIFRVKFAVCIRSGDARTKRPLDRYLIGASSDIFDLGRISCWLALTLETLEYTYRHRATYNRGAERHLVTVGLNPFEHSTFRPAGEQRPAHVPHCAAVRFIRAFYASNVSLKIHHMKLKLF